MMKRLLTILTLTICYTLFYSWQSAHTKEIEITYSPTLTHKFISPYILEVNSDIDIQEVELSTQDKATLQYKADFISPKRVLIEFQPLPTGWFSEVLLSVKTDKLKHHVKIFIELPNPNQAQLRIISFAPIANKKRKQNIEFKVVKTGSLAGICVRIDQPRNTNSTFYLPDINLKEGETWTLIFCAQEKTTWNLPAKTITLPLVLSHTSACICLIERPQKNIQDMLIYRSLPVSKCNGWGTDTFEKAIKNLQKLPGFTYSLHNTAQNILSTKGIKSKEKIIRKDLKQAFTTQNAVRTSTSEKKKN